MHFYKLYWNVCSIHTVSLCMSEIQFVCIIRSLKETEDCSEQRQWKTAEVVSQYKKHIYWTAASSSSGQERVAKWTSILNHVQDMHTWSSFPTVFASTTHYKGQEQVFESWCVYPIVNVNHVSVHTTDMTFFPLLILIMSVFIIFLGVFTCF